MMHKPIFSIIVPCYRSQDTLSETLESVNSQSMESWECIVVDDGSPDECWKIAMDWSKRDRRFRVVKQTNKGLPLARNAGIMASNAEYLLFLDSDDLIEPEKLQTHHRCGLYENIIAYGGCKFLQENGKFSEGREPHSEPWQPLKVSKSMDVMRRLSHGNILPVSCPIVPKLLATQIAGFDGSLSSFEDWDFWIRLTLEGVDWRFDRATQSDTIIRVRSGSMSSDSFRMFRNEWIVRRKHRSEDAFTRQNAKLKRFHIKAAIKDVVNLKIMSAIQRIRVVFS